MRLNNVKTAEEVGGEIIASMRERMANPKEVTGIPTGFHYFDRLIRGIQPNSYNILAARPNVGKSALAGGWCESVALQFAAEGTGKRVRIITFEMSAKAYQERIVSARTRVSLNKIETGLGMTQELAQVVTEETERLMRLPIDFLEDRVPWMDIVEFIKRDNACGLFMLDHIGIIPGINNPMNPTAGRANASIALAELCHKYAPGLIISHLNRECEKREDKRPILADLYGADQIGQDADLVLALYREDMYKKIPDEERDNPQRGELLILKNRNGRVGRKVSLVFDPNSVEWFEDPSIYKEGAA